MSKLAEKIYTALGILFFLAAMAMTGTMDFEDAKLMEQHQLTAAQKKAVVACWQE